jgi:segregation and condensation protein A
MKIATPEAKAAPHPLTTVKLGDENCHIQATGNFRDQDAADYIPNPESEQLRIEVPVFDGPLDLLLHLIKKHSMDIFDIPIVVITQKYLEAIESMEEFNIDLAGEFLLMAATLLHIKSKMLLPKEEQPQEEEDDGVDPRAELVRRLLEYQRFKEVAEMLKGRSHLGSDVFLRPANLDAPFFTTNLSDHDSDDAPVLENVQIFELLGLFADIIEAKQPQLAHTVKFEKISIRARMSELVEFSRLRVDYDLRDALSYFQVKNRYDVIVTFLAMLECARLKLLTIKSTEEGSSLHIEAVKENLWTEGGEAFQEDYG